MGPYTLLVLAVSLATVSCGTGHSLYRGEPDVGSPDADADSDSDSDSDTLPDTDVDGDVAPDGDRPLQCGDEREPLDMGPEPIVNGERSWDPTVVALSRAQGMSVGALLTRHLTPDWANVCTATLIAPTVVLTAAHCVIDFWEDRDLNPWEVRFAVGEDAASPVAVLEPIRLIRHPEYDFWAGTGALHDVAVLVLAEPADLAIPGIVPIEANCAPLPDSFVGSLVQNVGYGMTDPTGATENSQRWWTVEEVVDLTDFDFTVDGYGISGVCFGDSGGPSLWTMPDGAIRVVGTVSWGDESCVDNDWFARSDDNCDLWDDLVTPDPCDGETPGGRCDGGVAVWCERDEVVRADCAALGLTCGPDGSGRWRCVEVIDPCNGETFTGRCAGTTAVWCEDGRVRREDCSGDRRICSVDADGLARCTPDPCRGITWVGRCIAGSAVWCHDGEVRIRRCADCGQACGWSDDLDAYYCVGP